MGNIRLIAELSLVLLVVGLMWCVKGQKSDLDSLESANLKLQSNLRSSVTITRTQVKYRWRDSSGTVHGVDVHVPTEGGTEVIDPIKPGGSTDRPPTGSFLEDLFRRNMDSILGRITKKTFVNPETGQKVIVTRAGITFYPALAGTLSINSGMGLGLQARLLYFEKYGMGIGVSSREYVYTFIDRRIEDFVPFMRNTAVGIHGGYRWDRGEKVLGMQTAIFF